MIWSALVLMSVFFYPETTIWFLSRVGYLVIFAASVVVAMVVFFG